MKIIERHIRIENDFVLISISPSFKKELNRQLTEIFKPLISRYISLDKMSIALERFPEQVNESNIMKCSGFAITNPYSYTEFGSLFWKNKNGDLPIKLEDEVEKDEIEFWIDDLNYERLADDLKKMAFVQNKVYLDGYRFVVQIQQISLDSEIKIILSKPIDNIIKEKIEAYLNYEVDNFNQNNILNKTGGLIHSLDLTEYKKNKYLKFSIDYGSSGEEGIHLIFKILNISNFPIDRIEVKGK